MTAFLILGCGYTGERVARRLLDRGARVHATTRDPARLARLAERGANVASLDVASARSVSELHRSCAAMGPLLRVLYSIPVPRAYPPIDVAEILRPLAGRADRVVHLSTTAVYGQAVAVDEHTPAVPCDDEGRLRLDAERGAADGPWSTLVLRPAAIYGPHRGVHALLRHGTLGKVRDLDRVVSRVHVDDLAALSEAALLSDVSGVFPVADDEPATTREVAAFCRELGLPDLPPRPADEPRTGSPGRIVSGRAIRERLGIALRYPSYRSGIPAAMQEELVDGKAPGP